MAMIERPVLVKIKVTTPSTTTNTAAQKEFGAPKVNVELQPETSGLVSTGMVSVP
jgi:hypothetical protein